MCSVPFLRKRKGGDWIYPVPIRRRLCGEQATPTTLYRVEVARLRLDRHKLVSVQHYILIRQIVKNRTNQCAEKQTGQSPELPDDNSKREPPDSIPNSVVKPLSADGSVGFPHVRVGHCQASNK